MAEWGDWYPFVGGGKFRQNLRDPNRIQYQPLLPMDFIEVSIKVEGVKVEEDDGTRMVQS